MVERTNTRVCSRLGEEAKQRRLRSRRENARTRGRTRVPPSTRPFVPGNLGVAAHSTDSKAKQERAPCVADRMVASRWFGAAAFNLMSVQPRTPKSFGLPSTLAACISTRLFNIAPPPQHPGKPASRLIHHPSQPSRPMRTQLLMAAASAACASAFLLPLSSPQQRAPLLQRRAASTRMMVCTRVRWWVVGPWKPQPQHVDRSIDWFDRPPLSTTQQMKSSTPHSLKTTRRPPPPPPPPRPRPPPPR